MAGVLPHDSQVATHADATVWAWSGRLKRVAPPDARFDHDPGTGDLRGLVQEAETTNTLSNGRDLASDEWLATDMGLTPVPTDLDEEPGTGTLLRALAAGATVLSEPVPAAAEAGPFTASCWVRRQSGLGRVDVTADGGETWHEVTALLLGGAWERIQATAATPEPSVGLRLGAAGDEIEVDLCQLEAQPFATSEMPTAGEPQSRNAEPFRMIVIPGVAQWRFRWPADAEVSEARHVQRVSFVQVAAPNVYDVTVEWTDPINGGMRVSVLTDEVLDEIETANRPPVASDDAAATDEDTAATIPVLANDHDADGDALAVVNVGAPANGTASINADGTVTYTSKADFNGADAFSYTVSDGQGGTATAMVTVTVRPVNDAPVAVDDAAATDEDTAVTIRVLANDHDVDGDALAVVNVGAPTNGTASINADGTVTYTPAAGFHGADGFSYTVSDGHGGTATASVSVTVSPVNHAPVAVDDTAATDANKSVAIRVLDNDHDADGDALRITHVTKPANGRTSIRRWGALEYVLYRPNKNFTGEDRFTYTVSDGNGGTATATVTVTVGAVYGGLQATDDSAVTLEGAKVKIRVLDNDRSDPGSPLSVVGLGSAGNGRTNFASHNPNVVVYRPNEGFTGEDRFTYAVSDGQGGVSTATVTVTVVGL